ncbi:MAG: hypothetical protein Q8O03_04765 [Nanoarchaeota archaeon]|nr:hypothetical protein [Nanoarchaeota archaeon]
MIGEMISAFIAIIVGVVTVVKLIGDAELIVNALSLTFGVTAIIWVFKARKSLSKGSSLRSLTTNFLFILIFILCFSFWSLVVKMLGLEQAYGEVVVLVEYMFISFAYITIVGTAYKIRKLGHEFGFTTQSKEIEELINNKKKKKK